MKEKVRKIIYRWYYSRCGKHFAQYPFRKSVKLLIQNYEHQKLLIEDANEILSVSMKSEDELRKQLTNLRTQLSIHDTHIDWANRNFGTNYKKPSEN